MKFLLQLLRSIIFTLAFSLNFIGLVLVMLMSKLFHCMDFFMRYSKLWARWNVLLLKYICGINYRIIGAENIPENNFLAVAKHQSTWECYFLHAYLPGYPVSVSKREISLLPLFGMAIYHIGTLKIDRRDTTGSLKKILQQSQEFVRKGRNIFMIFPQGTRVPVGAGVKEYPYKAGFISIAKVNQLDILPISLNSGEFWPKFKFIKTPGTITVKIMPLLRYQVWKNMSKDELLQKVQNLMEEQI